MEILVVSGSERDAHPYATHDVTGPRCVVVIFSRITPEDSYFPLVILDDAELFE